MKLLLETLLALGQNTFNYALSLDSITQQSLQELQNRCIAVHIKTLENTIYLLIDNQAIYLSLRPPKALDLTISASIKNLWHLSQKNQTPHQHVDMQGNMHVAQKLSQIIQDFQPDWEEALTHTLGDVAGHALAKTIVQVHAYAKQIAADILRQSADYVVDETPIIAAKASIDHFISQVTELRSQCDRFEARVNLLKRV